MISSYKQTSVFVFQTDYYYQIMASCVRYHVENDYLNIGYLYVHSKLGSITQMYIIANDNKKYNARIFKPDDMVKGWMNTYNLTTTEHYIVGYLYYNNNDFVVEFNRK